MFLYKRRTGSPYLKVTIDSDAILSTTVSNSTFSTFTNIRNYSSTNHYLCFDETFNLDPVIIDNVTL